MPRTWSNFEKSFQGRSHFQPRRWNWRTRACILNRDINFVDHNSKCLKTKALQTLSHIVIQNYGVDDHWLKTVWNIWFGDILYHLMRSIQAAQVGSSFQHQWVHVRYTLRIFWRTVKKETCSKTCFWLPNWCTWLSTTIQAWHHSSMTFYEVWATSDSESVYQDTTLMIEGFWTRQHTTSINL